MFLGAMTMAVSALAPTSADACIHGKVFRPQVNPQMRDVRTSERLLARNQHDRAIKKAKRAFPEFDQLPPGDTVAALFDRAQRTAAMAVVRADGAVGLGAGWSGKTERDNGAVGRRSHADRARLRSTNPDPTFERSVEN